jgi:hypothetical protein
MPVPSPRNKILPVRGNIATLQSNVASLLEGEICYALDENKFYVKESGVLVEAGGGGATGTGSNRVFHENDQTVTADYTLTSGKNAMTAGPVTINSGITVTVPSGQTWTIV